jgi:hypothetical protein
MVSTLREVDPFRRSTEIKVIAMSEQTTNAGSNRGRATTIICSSGGSRVEGFDESRGQPTFVLELTLGGRQRRVARAADGEVRWSTWDAECQSIPRMNGSNQIIVFYF